MGRIQTLKIILLLKCVDSTLPLDSVEVLEQAALEIEKQATPIVVRVLRGTVIVERVMVDYDPSAR